MTKKANLRISQSQTCSSRQCHLRHSPWKALQIYTANFSSIRTEPTQFPLGAVLGFTNRYIRAVGQRAQVEVEGSAVFSAKTGPVTDFGDDRGDLLSVAPLFFLVPRRWAGGVIFELGRVVPPLRS